MGKEQDTVCQKGDDVMERKYGHAERCYFCGYGPAGTFELWGENYDQPICEGCLDEAEACDPDFDDSWGDAPIHGYDC